MSTSNIVQIVPTEGGVIVTFLTHRGDQVSYFYDQEAGAQILNGADPADFVGTRL